METYIEVVYHKVFLGIIPMRKGEEQNCAEEEACVRQL